MPDAATTTSYRARRAEGWMPAYALAWARDEVALVLAEQDDLVRIVIEQDDDYQPEPAGDDAESARWYAADIAAFESGAHVAYGVRLLVPDTCPHCAHVLAEQWKDAGSIWGCVIDMAGCNGYPERDSYLRSVAHDLAREAGVIA